MTTADHEELLRILVSLPFCVMLSGYDCPLYREALKGWRVETIKTRCWSSPTQREVVEYVWMNYDQKGELL